MKWLAATVEENYAGYFDKVTSNEQIHYKKIKDSLLFAAEKTSTLDYPCYKLLRTYLKYFNDPHLSLGFDTEHYKNKVINFFQTGFPLHAGNGNTTKSTGKFSGIWKDESSSFELMFSKISAGHWIGYVINSDSLYWHKNQIKIELEKKREKYIVKYYTRDHSLISDTISIKDEIKVFSQISLVRSDKKLKEKGNGFLFKKIGNIAYFRLPNFMPQNYRIVDSLLTIYKKDEGSIKKFIIDIRNNTGGSSLCYRPFLPYIYTDTVLFYGGATRKSPENINFYVNAASDTFFPASSRKFFKYRADLITNSPDNFVRADSIYYFTLDKVTLNPEKVVFLINDRCLSAAELFLNYAVQSKKAILMGQETYGGMNYLEVNSSLHLPCGFIKLNYPIYRSDRVDYVPDARGVKPDIYLTQPESEWLKIALKYLKTK